MSATKTHTDEVDLLRQEIVVLRAQIEWLKKQLFGGGKSETLDRAQLLLQLEQLEQRIAAPARAPQTITYQRDDAARAPRPAPAETFAHLPVRERVEIIPEPVRAQPEAYEKIGEERTFEVDVVPPRLFRREIVRPKFRRKADRTQPPLIAPAPARVVQGGYASAGLLAWVTVAKYVDHLPLYRQENMLTRWGAPMSVSTKSKALISRQTLCDWIALTAHCLEPLYRLMHRDLIAGAYLQCDETPVRCNDPDQKRGGTTQGWMWVLSRPGGDAVFAWRDSRRHGELATLLDGFRGVLQSDAYAAYPAFARDHADVTWVGCWAHARRHFFEAQAESPKAVHLILRLIGRLYAFEREWDEADVGARRAALRQQHFARPLRWLRRVAVGLRAKSLPRSQLGQACAYLLEHWDALVAHLQHSITRLDTNLVENAIRPSAIGKKNWLFIGHPDAGDRSAIIYSIVVSCQRHGKDPLAYLRDVLTRLPAMSNQDDLKPLLSAHWQPGDTASAS